jgi:DNA-binding transcriptional ArsR family regulator
MYHLGVATGDVFQAIADPTRRRLLELLAESERPVKELAAPFRMSQPAISQHLRVLREAGLVSERREGRHHHYRLNPEPLRDVADWVARYQRFWDQRLTALERYLDEEKT